MAEAWTPEWVEEQIQKEHVEWSECTRCDLSKGRHKVVYGSGDTSADILFIGENPGMLEDESGVPFHPEGPSGALFNDLLEAAGINRNEVFVTNLLGCKPPENRDPKKVERQECWARVHRIIYLIDPILIVPVGSEAMKFLIGGKWSSIKEKAGKLGEVVIQGAYRQVTYHAIPIMHPSYILREDQPDSRTGKWPSKGYATMTMKQLNHIRRVTALLKAEYETHSNSLRRHPALKVIT